jgi:hypothetical protein
VCVCGCVGRWGVDRPPPTRVTVCEGARQTFMSSLLVRVATPDQPVVARVQALPRPHSASECIFLCEHTHTHAHAHNFFLRYHRRVVDKERDAAILDSGALCARFTSLISLVHKHLSLVAFAHSSTWQHPMKARLHVSIDTLTSIVQSVAQLAWSSELSYVSHTHPTHPHSTDESRERPLSTH